ncbi:helix-turn-helix domain-containing protein, partial [Vibrio parahaemolyticus]|nr:helix-turn-helix domain-containing protein [Vibrio parahaemolyticus]MDG2686101.1 helix-turn-helix domain-containing protein [Vibrio parahaemolyticus]
MRKELPKLLYTLDELVEVLSISRATINRLRSEGSFPLAFYPTASKALRWKAKDIDDWIVHISEHSDQSFRDYPITHFGLNRSL